MCKLKSRFYLYFGYIINVTEDLKSQDLDLNFH